MTCIEYEIFLVILTMVNIIYCGCFYYFAHPIYINEVNVNNTTLSITQFKRAIIYDLQNERVVELTPV